MRLLANRTVVYRLNTAEMPSWRVAVEGEDDIPLLEAVAMLLEEGEAPEGVAEAVLNYFAEGPDGVEYITEFSTLWEMFDDLEVITAGLPESLRERLLNDDPVEGSFPQEFNSLLRVLNFPGWYFLTREEIEMMAEKFRQTEEEKLNCPFIWEEIFAVTAERDWDVILFATLS